VRKSRAVDPDSMNPDSDTDPDPDTIRIRVLMIKNWKKYTAENFSKIFF
jgi:hypothetical protein